MVSWAGCDGGSFGVFEQVNDGPAPVGATQYLLQFENQKMKERGLLVRLMFYCPPHSENTRDLKPASFYSLLTLANFCPEGNPQDVSCF